MKTNKGFTLIELLVVVLIIGILAAIAVPKYQIAVLKSKLARAKQTASDIRKAYEIYHLQNGVYPTSFNQLDFANKFDDSNIIDTSDYTCYINSYQEIICSIGVRNYSIKYYINLYTYHTNKITTWCQAESADTSSINHKVCQQDTGKTASQAACHGSDYCLYEY